MIGGDGQTYEIRGWNYENGMDHIPRKSSIVIGFVGDCFKIQLIYETTKSNSLLFLGNYNINSPSIKQLKNAYSLIEEMRRRQLLHDDFKIFGFQNLTNSFTEGGEIIREIAKWKRFSTTLKML